ncbi:hypothetical protein DACRYDRAFT_23273 [Dacryopinax primogenitus]|uniref:Uncharacterized protein n=1 Tax=Dacryopinax primogenitus (strain DJM 731) TaxID=1858805 RepID=M5FX87_DACPD|nr:uncharacterized protein DACRYDRAFT_23273 [Dacryopinax primogenitus]EJU00370.1 hypothetical protein DACRYDRAFT_23273 [Dacryopinax primogenitus]
MGAAAVNIPRFSSHQIDWLKERLPAYVSSCDGRRGEPLQFTKAQATAFLAAFPDYFALEAEIPADLWKALRTKIDTWFKNHKRMRGQQTIKLEMKSPRHQPTAMRARELMAAQRDDIPSLVRAKAEELNKHSLGARSIVTKQLWEDLPDTTKDVFMAAARAERAEGVNTECSLSEREKQKNILKLPRTAASFIRSLKEKTGWTFLLLSGGRQFGKGLGTLVVGEGETCETNLRFQEYHENWEGHVKRPWIEFVNAFVGEERAYGIPCLPEAQRDWTETDYRTMMLGWMEAVWAPAISQQKHPEGFPLVFTRTISKLAVSLL